MVKAARVLALFLSVFLTESSKLKSNDIAGQYSDPNHPGCARTIITTGRTTEVYGADAAGGEGIACDGTTDVAWGPLNGTLVIVKITVDFSPKGGPSDLSGIFKDGAINWEDGNSWLQLPPPPVA